MFHPWFLPIFLFHSFSCFCDYTQSTLKTVYSIFSPLLDAHFKFFLKILLEVGETDQWVRTSLKGLGPEFRSQAHISVTLAWGVIDRWIPGLAGQLVHLQWRALSENERHWQEYKTESRHLSTADLPTCACIGTFTHTHTYVHMHAYVPHIPKIKIKAIFNSYPSICSIHSELIKLQQTTSQCYQCPVLAKCSQLLLPSFMSLLSRISLKHKLAYEHLAQLHTHTHTNPFSTLLILFWTSCHLLDQWRQRKEVFFSMFF